MHHNMQAGGLLLKMASIGTPDGGAVAPTRWPGSACLLSQAVTISCAMGPATMWLSKEGAARSAL